MDSRHKIRVNLGSGRDYIEGWVNVDIEKSYKVDVIADLSKRFPFEDNSVDEIKASDIIEHFTKEGGEKFLKECHRVLKPGGIIKIRTHNIYQIIKQFKNDPEVLIHFLYGDTKETSVFGAHKFAYTKETLSKFLIKIGYKINSLEKEQTNFFVIAEKLKYRSTKPVAIGVIIQAPDIGGAETYMYSLINSFIQEGNKVSLASNYKRLLAMYDGLPVKKYYVPAIIDIIGNLRGLIKSILLLPLITYHYIQVLNKFKKDKVDVILMSNFSEKLLVSFLSLFYHIPVVWIEYGPLVTVFQRNFCFPKIVYRLLKNIPRKIIVPSENTLHSMIIDAHVSFAKLALIPCGINISKKVNISRGEIAPNLEKKFIIGNVSRATIGKGQEYLLKAMPSVLKKIPEAFLLLIGNGPDLDYYKSLAKKLHIEKNVFFPGFVENLQDYYAIMDIFVFPTVWELEGFGLVVPEAMAYKIPVLGSDFGPVREIIDDGKTGILFSPKNEGAITHAIIDLYNNSQKRKALVDEAYKKVTISYNIKKVSKTVLELLKEATIKV